MSDRLEEIKEELVMNVKLKIEDVNWLIQQAERVEELEEEIKTHAPNGRNYTNEQYIGLLQENQRYRQALELLLSYIRTEPTVPDEIIEIVERELEAYKW